MLSDLNIIYGYALPTKSRRSQTICSSEAQHRTLDARQPFRQLFATQWYPEKIGISKVNTQGSTNPTQSKGDRQALLRFVIDKGKKEKRNKISR
jgi:hypothetical protein